MVYKDALMYHFRGMLFQYTNYKRSVTQLMSFPFIPEEDIIPTYFAIKKWFVDLTQTELELVKSSKDYLYKT